MSIDEKAFQIAAKAGLWGCSKPSLRRVIAAYDAAKESHQPVQRTDSVVDIAALIEAVGNEIDDLCRSGYDWNVPAGRFMKILKTHAALLPKRESGWVSVKDGLPEDFEDCLIWLKPVNGNGQPHWSVRKGSFRNGSFSEWGEDKSYSPDTYKRITHWRLHAEMPPLSEIEGGSQ
jgi:hypothetical protein